MGEVKEEKKKEDAKKEEEIVLKVDMHCEACARKVAKALKGFQGVEDVSTDCKASKVVVKGKTADPVKVCERLQFKSGKKVELISPLPKPSQAQTQAQAEPKKQESTPTEEKPPAVVTTVLNIRMHCEACAQVLQKRIRKIQGVESVEVDIANNQVIVKGTLDAEKLVSAVYKRTGKQASITKKEEKKEVKKDEKKEDEKEGEVKVVNKEEDDKKIDMKQSEYSPSKLNIDYAYAPQIFSDENPNACSIM